MTVDCWNFKCKFRSLEGCTLETITIGGSGLCKEGDYDEDDAE